MSIHRTAKTRGFPEGGWEVRYRDNFSGTRRQTFRTKQEALDFEATVRTDKRHGDFIDPRKATTPLGKVAERWFETTANLKPKTRAGYRNLLDANVLPAFGEKPIGRISPSDIKSMLARTGVSPGTQRNILRVLSPIFEMAMDDGRIRRNPCRRVKLPKSAQTEMQFLSPVQAADLAEEVGERYGIIVTFAAYTGLRSGEIAGLRVRDLDLMRGRVTVRASVSDVSGRLHIGTPKNGKTRTIGLPRFLVDELMARVAGKGPEAYVFGGLKGGPLRHANFYARHFKPAVGRLVDRGDWPEHLGGLRFHDLRHTAAAILIAQGVHPKAIANRLGHSSISITMDRYGHLYPDHEEAIVAGLDETYRTAREPEEPSSVARFG